MNRPDGGRGLGLAGPRARAPRPSPAVTAPGLVTGPGRRTGTTEDWTRRSGSLGRAQRPPGGTSPGGTPGGSLRVKIGPAAQARRLSARRAGPCPYPRRLGRGGPARRRGRELETAAVLARTRTPARAVGPSESPRRLPPPSLSTPTGRESRARPTEPAGSGRGWGGAEFGGVGAWRGEQRRGGSSPAGAAALRAGRRGRPGPAGAPRW